MQDQRRKLDPLDYSRIRYQFADLNCTIREISNAMGVSTKYVRKILNAQVIFQDEGDTRFIMTDGSIPQIERYPCSGCGSAFGNRSGLMVHMEIWTSGGMKALDCLTVMPR